MIAIDAIVVTAMAEESAPFLEHAEHVGRPSQVGHAVHRLLELDGHAVLLVECGIGLVNSATAAAVALTGTSPRVLISAGSAGGVGTDVRVGDVVVGSTYVFAGADARAFGYALGQIPGMPAQFTGDDGLLAAALRTEVTADPRSPQLRVVAGQMLSGDAFIDATLVDAIRESFPQALSTDMETTALAQTCYQYGVPYVSIRGISDLCGPSADADHAQHVDDAADRSAAVVISALRQLGPRA